MIQTFMDIIILVTFLTHLSSGIPIIKSPIRRAAEAILRRPQGFNSAMEGQRTNEREERSINSAAEGQRRHEICEVEELTILLRSDLPVAGRKCKTPGIHTFLGEGYMCKQDYQTLSFSGISKLVPSGCSLWAVDTLVAELSSLTEDSTRHEGLELSSDLQIVAEHRFCESVGVNRGNHRLEGREYSCEQQHLVLETDLVSPTLLESGCVCYHNWFGTVTP